MTKLRVRLAVTATASALVLAGCTPADSDPPEPAETSAAPTPTSSESPDTSEDEDGDVDEQGGVRTNSFNAMPGQLGDLRMVSSESDPSVHRFEREYMTEDQQSRLFFMAHIPSTGDGGFAPVSRNSDPGFRSSADSAKRHFEEQGHDLVERSASAGGHDWECFEALQTQTGDIDHSFCLTTEHGRVIELQRLAIHDPDEQARNSHMDVLMDETSAALVDIAA